MKSIMKIFVNLLTISRFLFSLFLLFLFKYLTRPKFLLIITLLFLTDLLDGFLARKFEVQTKFGAMMDTIADKTLCIVLIFPLLSISYFSLLLLIGEILIACLNGIAFTKGKHTQANFYGKAKMWVISITIILGYICKFGYMNSIIFMIGCCITFVVQIYTFVSYIKYLKSN